VLSDHVTALLMTKSNDLSDKINDSMKKVVTKPTSFKKIVDQYMKGDFGSITKLVDGGLAGDLDYIYKSNRYDGNNALFLGNFCDFENYDSIFICTVIYISPFHRFNLSSMIKPYKNSNMTLLAKYTIANILKLADIWGIAIIYAIHIHDTNVKGMSHKYMADLKKIHNNNNEFMTMPFVIQDGVVKLVQNLVDALDTTKDLVHVEYHGFRNCVVDILEQIMSFVNMLLSNSSKTKHAYALNYDAEMIHLLYRESGERLCNIGNIMDQFCAGLKECLGGD